MIIFLFGQDTYRSRGKLREIIEEYKKRHQSGLNFIKINFNEKEFGDFKQAVETASMFDEKKLVVAEEVFNQPEYFQEELQNYLDKKKIEKKEDVIVVFSAEEVKSDNKLIQFLKNKAKVEKFEPLSGYRLREWIKNYVINQRARIDNLAVEKLINYVGNDLWRMANEINKLISFKIGDVRRPRDVGRQISAEDVEELVKPEIDVNIFHIIDALGQKNKKQALKLVHDYFKKGESSGYLFDRFVYQFRNLIKVKTGGGKDLHPFVFKKTLQQAKNFSFEELKKIYRKLLEIDLDIKTGRTNAKTALEMFVVNL